MPIQAYNIYTAKGYAGDRYDSAPSVTQSGRAEVPFGYGLGLQLGTNKADLPPDMTNVTAAQTSVWGVSMRELNHEAANRPSDGTTNYVVGETVSVMREGFLLVKVGGTLGATAHTKANLIIATGEFTGDAPGGGVLAMTNVTFLETGLAGETVKARIDIVHV